MSADESADESIMLRVLHDDYEYTYSLGVDVCLIVIERSFNESMGLNIRLTYDGFLITPYDTPNTEQLKDDAILETINGEDVIPADISFVRHEDDMVVYMIKLDLFLLREPTYFIGKRNARFRNLLTKAAEHWVERTEVFQFNYNGIHVSPMERVAYFVPKPETAD